MNNALSAAEIEKAMERLSPSFSLSALMKAVDGGRSDVIRRRLERVIESDDRFFYDDKYNCRLKSDFFSRRSFLITPDEWELSQKILLPGHRFVPWIGEEVFPSDIELRCDGKTVEKKEISVPLGQVFHYFMLLGSDQIFDYLMAESQANAGISGHGSDMATLTVFDLKPFFAAHVFQPGDALLCRVADYEKGIVEAGFLSSADRQAAERMAWVEALDFALETVCKKFADYLDIPGQLAWGVFFAGNALEKPAASLDEFILGSRRIEIRAEGEHAVLSLRQEEAEESEQRDRVHSLFSISDGELDNPARLLAEAGSPLSMAELEGFMLDAIYGRESDFDGVYSRAFGHAALDFADEARQVTLLNALEERFEELRDNYNRIDDERKAPLRSSIMETVDDRLEFFSFLGSLEGEPGDAEHQLLHRLADVGSRLSEVLKLLNDPRFTPDETEFSQLSERVDQCIAEHEELIEEFDSGCAKPGHDCHCGHDHDHDDDCGCGCGHHHE